MARIHGNRGDVMMDPTGGSTAVSIASLAEWSLDLSKDRVDVTAFGDVNKQKVTGLPDYSGSFSGWWDATTSPTQIFDVILGSVTPLLKLVPDRLAPTFFFSGLANLDGSIKVSATGAVSISGKFDAAGPWTMAP